jgi:hypothetical protein
MMPTDLTLPFLAYGIFRPGQLAFFQLTDFVGGVVDPVPVPGQLLVRDGLPTVEFPPAGDSAIEGALLHFRSGTEAPAYNRISDMEPDAQYRWETHKGVNILVARQPSHGSDKDIESWDGWQDPVFTAALDVVQETLARSREFDPGDIRPTFRLQMAYLLLWTSIERYLSLRYYLGPQYEKSKNEQSKDEGPESQPRGMTTSSLVMKLAAEAAFADALKREVTGSRRIYRADNPKKPEDLKPTDPKKSVKYYYQVRSNITHRGKGVQRDHDTLVQSLSELLSIFRAVRKGAKAESERLRESFTGR